MTVAKREKGSPAVIRKNTAIIFIIMAFALGLYGGHLISSLTGEETPGLTRQSIKAELAAEAGQAPESRPENLPENSELDALLQAAAATAAGPEDLKRLGHWYYGHKLPEEAATAYRRALELARQVKSPEDPEVLTHLGLCYRALHRHDEALESLRRAALVSPGYAPALYNMGIAFLDLGRKNEAVTAWQELQEHNPGFVTPMGMTISQALEMLKKQ